MHLQESGEMYLESIYLLLQNNARVRSIDICEYMSFSKPSVSRAVGLLKNGGFINISDEGFITLTEIGLATAKKVFERHTVITNFLQSIGVSKETAADDACRIEHVISDESFNALKKQLK